MSKVHEEYMCFFSLFASTIAPYSDKAQWACSHLSNSFKEISSDISKDCPADLWIGRTERETLPTDAKDVKPKLRPQMTCIYTRKLQTSFPCSRRTWLLRKGTRILCHGVSCRLQLYCTLIWGNVMRILNQAWTIDLRKSSKAERKKTPFIKFQSNSLLRFASFKPESAMYDFDVRVNFKEPHKSRGKLSSIVFRQVLCISRGCNVRMWCDVRSSDKALFISAMETLLRFPAV